MLKRAIATSIRQTKQTTAIAFLLIDSEVKMVLGTADVAALKAATTASATILEIVDRTKG